MAYIEANIPPQKVWVRKGFLFDDPDLYSGEYELGVLISVRCLEGSVALFQVLFENGRMRDKLPIHALCWKKPETESVWDELPFHYLQLWDCFSRTFSLVKYNYISNCKVDVIMKNKKTLTGNYLWTIQWAEDIDSQCDISLAEDWTEHKSHNFIALENGLFALQPNNRITRWYEPSLVTKQPTDEQWKVNTMKWSSEMHEKWITEDSSSYFYDTSNANSTEKIVWKNVCIKYPGLLATSPQESTNTVNDITVDWEKLEELGF